MVDEAVVYPERGEIIALVKLSESSKQILDNIAAVLSDLKKGVNAKLAAFSQITRIEIATNFEKTATEKIKRFLYLGAPKSGTV
jgi:hypothetical protein